jgi:hypothetical protein
MPPLHDGMTKVTSQSLSSIRRRRCNVVLDRYGEVESEGKKNEPDAPQGVSLAMINWIRMPYFLNDCHRDSREVVERQGGNGMLDGMALNGNLITKYSNLYVRQPVQY